mmetsp:Transcript_20791/g.42273  ORF Transcript_20791/g.42273 Transcript_20791/m.42273 type:complete len:96 (+) Transcript_20791:64-351(+)
MEMVQCRQRTVDRTESALTLSLRSSTLLVHKQARKDAFFVLLIRSRGHPWFLVRVVDLHVCRANKMTWHAAKYNSEQVENSFVTGEMRDFSSNSH